MNSRILPPKLSHESIVTYKDAIRKMEHIKDMDQEVVILITCNFDCRIIGEHLIAVGTMEETLIDYRLLLNRIITDKATRFIIGHNHVNGLSFFSPEDFIAAARLKYISKVLNLDFLDELLFAHNRDVACMSQRHPKFWHTDFYRMIDDEIQTMIPRIKG
jgi:DNA repair protein RadC